MFTLASNKNDQYSYLTMFIGGASVSLSRCWFSLTISAGSEKLVFETVCIKVPYFLFV